jgi:hypothetical protein
MAGRFRDDRAQISLFRAQSRGYLMLHSCPRDSHNLRVKSRPGRIEAGRAEPEPVLSLHPKRKQPPQLQPQAYVTLMMGPCDSVSAET